MDWEKGLFVAVSGERGGVGAFGSAGVEGWSYRMDEIWGLAN